MHQISFDDERNHLERLSKLGDPLEHLDQVIDWEQFRPILTNAIENSKTRKAKDNRGRPSYDVVAMFKILVLQHLYHLSDDKMQYELYDRISFMRFAGFSIGDRMPDAKTIWLYRSRLTKAGAIDSSFALFEKQLEQAHLISRAGFMIDATFVEAPRPRRTQEENQTGEAGEIPEEWESEESTH